jgi:hypothetical protein
MKIKLTRIKSTHDELKAAVVEGTAPYLPEVGYRFEMLAEPLDNTMSARVVVTTPIVAVEQIDSTYRFKTKHSEYQLEIL